MTRALLCLALFPIACSSATANRVSDGGQTGAEFVQKRRAAASAAFFQHWADGKAELSGYRVKTRRYGQPRSGELVLIYVTEPLDARTMVKDDNVKPPHRLEVLKLNAMLTFSTGIYPYSVMRSIFAPVDDFGGHRFSPLKIAFSAQEWCGHVYHQVRPLEDAFRNSVRSYFASEGERDELVNSGPGALYEDGLLIQLRELDGLFNEGKDWAGQLVPGLWSARKAHRPLRPVPAKITRRTATVDGKQVTRFELSHGDTRRTFDVEVAAPRRILGWTASDGEQVTLLKSVRLPYWSLHDNGHESYREQLGLKASR